MKLPAWESTCHPLQAALKYTFLQFALRGKQESTFQVLPEGASSLFLADGAVPSAAGLPTQGIGKRGQPGDETEAVAVRGPDRLPVVIPRCQFHHLRSIRNHFVDAELAISVGGECDLSVTGPGRFSIFSRIIGEPDHLSACHIYDAEVDIAKTVAFESNAIPIRRPRSAPVVLLVLSQVAKILPVPVGTNSSMFPLRNVVIMKCPPSGDQSGKIPSGTINSNSGSSAPSSIR